MEERLQKYLASAGIASRRASEELIAQGRVTVNGQVVTAQGVKIIPGKDRVQVDGKNVHEEEKNVYLLLNKPSGYVTTMKDTHDRPIVTDLLHDMPYRVFPVGRLDFETEGLLLLTNDGEFAYRMTHPKFKLLKTYIATVRGNLTDERLEQLRKGILLEDGMTQPADVKILRKERHKTMVKISISEGRNRQIRRMFAAVKNPVLELKRISIGSLTLDKLPVGEYRHLTEAELQKIGQRLGLYLHNH